MECTKGGFELESHNQGEKNQMNITKKEAVDNITTEIEELKVRLKNSTDPFKSITITSQILAKIAELQTVISNRCL